MGSHDLATGQRRLVLLWLKGEEEPDSRKAEQYKRWRQLRKLQQTDNTGQKSN
jgi:hypothetical protein